jgi:hypothetical protein
MHHESEWGPRPERECGDEVHILGKKIEPVWPFLDGLDLIVELASLIIGFTCLSIIALAWVLATSSRVCLIFGSPNCSAIRLLI